MTQAFKEVSKRLGELERRESERGAREKERERMDEEREQAREWRERETEEREHEREQDRVHECEGERRMVERRLLEREQEREGEREKHSKQHDQVISLLHTMTLHVERGAGEACLGGMEGSAGGRRRGHSVMESLSTSTYSNLESVVFVRPGGQGRGGGGGDGTGGVAAEHSRGKRAGGGGAERERLVDTEPIRQRARETGDRDRSTENTERGGKREARQPAVMQQRREGHTQVRICGSNKYE